MSWLAWNPTAREELAELDRRDLHESIAADRSERADRHADQHPSSSKCPNHYCHNGWVDRGDNESRGAPAFPCLVCRVAFTPDQDPSSSTSAGASAPPPDGAASCSETLEEHGAVFSSDARDLPVVGATARSSSTSSTGLASRAEDADGMSADDLADWQHAQALRA